VLAPAHVFSTHHEFHWWHAVPAVVATGIAIVPTTIVTLPIMFVEECLGVDSVFSDARKSGAPPTASTYAVFAPAMAVGYVVALPFVIVGLPFEIDWRSAPPRPAPEPASDEPVPPPAPEAPPPAPREGGQASHR
jgi:hypothetical protein